MFSNDKYDIIIIILVAFILFLIIYNCLPCKTTSESFESVMEATTPESENKIVSEKLLPSNSISQQITDIEINIPVHLSEKYAIPMSDQTKESIATNKNLINNLLDELKSSDVVNPELINDKIKSENMKISNIVKAEYLDNLSDKLISEGDNDMGNLLKQSATITKLKTESLVKMDTLQELVSQEIAKPNSEGSSHLKKILTEYYHHLYKLKEILKYISILNENINNNSFDLSASKLRSQENKIKLLNNIEIYKSLSHNLSENDNNIIEQKINEIMEALKNSEITQEEINDNKYNALIKPEVVKSNSEKDENIIPKVGIIKSEISGNEVPITIVSEKKETVSIPKSVKNVNFDDMILPINMQEKNNVEGYMQNNLLFANHMSYDYDMVNKKKQIFSKIVGYDINASYDNNVL